MAEVIGNPDLLNPTDKKILDKLIVTFSTFGQIGVMTVDYWTRSITVTDEDGTQRKIGVSLP